jgi:hypothetical protein
MWRWKTTELYTCSLNDLRVLNLVNRKIISVITFTTRRETWSPPRVQGKQYATPSRCQVSRTAPRQETYLAQTHFRKMETRNHPHQNVLVTRTQVKTLHKQQTSLIQSNTQTNLHLRNTTLGYGFHFQHRSPRTLSIESFSHDSGWTLVHVEYGYPKGSPNTNS